MLVIDCMCFILFFNEIVVFVLMELVVVRFMCVIMMLVLVIVMVCDFCELKVYGVVKKFILCVC